MEYAAKAATAGVLAERAKMEYAARAGADGGDVGGVAGSAGGSRPGATAELSLPTLLPTTAGGQNDAAATAMEESVRQDGDGSSSYNADYNSFGPAQKRLFLRLLNSGMSPKDAALRIAQERDRAVVDADDDATEEDDRYAAKNGLGSQRHSDDEDDGPLMYADPAGDVSGGGLGESAKLLARAEEGEQSEDSDDLLVTSAGDVSESELAQEEGKSSYRGRYSMLAAGSLVPAIVRAKSRSKSKERHQMPLLQEYEEGVQEQATERQYQQAPVPDADGLQSSGISYYDAHGRGLDPHDEDYENSGLLDGNTNAPRGRSRKSKLLGAALAAKVVSSRQGGPGKRDVRYKNVTASSALPLTMAEDEYFAATVSHADNDGGAKSNFNIMSPKSLSSALSIMSRYPNSKRFSKLDSDLDLDQVAPSRSAEVEGMPSWLLPRDDEDDDNGAEDNVAEGETDEDDAVEVEEDKDDAVEREEDEDYVMEVEEDEDDVDEGEEYEDEPEEEEDDESMDGTEWEENTEDEFVSEVKDKVEPQSIPPPPPEPTWISPEMVQTRKTNAPDNTAILSPQGSNVDSLMLSPDSITSTYSPVSSPREPASEMVDKAGNALQRDAEDMPSTASSLAGNPEEDIASFMDQSTMAGSTFTSASRPHRKRHKGAASKRLLQAKQAQERFGSPKRNGWFDSIRDAASTQGKVWDPVVGWADYSEPEGHGIVDHDYSSIGSLHLKLTPKRTKTKGEHDTASNKQTSVAVPEKWEQERGTMIKSDQLSSIPPSIAGSRGVEMKSSADSTLNTGEEDTIFDSMTVTSVNTAAESYSVNGTSLSAPKSRAASRYRTTDRRKIASAYQDKKPVGWKESMENATSAVNSDGAGRHWDYARGWVRADGTADDDVSELTRSTLEGAQQVNQGRNIGVTPVTKMESPYIVVNNSHNSSKNIAVEESVPMSQLPPVVEEVLGDAYSASEEANLSTKSIEHIDDCFMENDIGEEELSGTNEVLKNSNDDMTDTIQPQGSDKENQESKKEVSSATSQLQYGDQRTQGPVPNKNNSKKSLNQWLEKANKNAQPKLDESENAAIMSDDTRESSSAHNLFVVDNKSKANSTQQHSTPFHYANFPDSFGEIERGVKEVKVIKEKCSDADSDLFEPSKIDLSPSLINKINRANFGHSPNLSSIPREQQRLALKKSESQDSNSTGLPPPPPPPPLSHTSSRTEDQPHSTVVSEMSGGGAIGAGRDRSRWMNYVDKRNRQQQLPVGEEILLASELDSNSPQVNKSHDVISSISNATTSSVSTAITSLKRSDPPPNLDPPSTSASTSFIGTKHAKKAAPDSWIQSRKDMAKKDEAEVEKSQAPYHHKPIENTATSNYLQSPSSDNPIENTATSNIVSLRSKFENNSTKSAPFFVPVNNGIAENQVFFRSTAMGIRLKRGEDGLVRVVSVTEASAGSSIVRDGVIEPEDMVLEAAGVDLRKPITNSQWGETVTKIRYAPRPMLFVVAAGPKRKVEEEQKYQQSQSRIPPPPAKYVMESRLSKSPEGQEVLESLSVARSYERVLESLSMARAKTPVFGPPSVKNTNNTSSQTSVEEEVQTASSRTIDNETTDGEEDQTVSRTEDIQETHQLPRKESLLKRITSGCVSPVNACTNPANQSSQQLSSQLNTSDDEGHVPMAHLQFLRTNPTIARVTNAASRRYPALCGRPDTIFEEPGDDDTRESRTFRMRERPSRRDIRQSSSRSSASTNDDGSYTVATATTYDAKTVGSNTAGSIGSSSGGDNTAFLEKLAIQSSVASKPTRPLRGEGSKNLAHAQKLSKAVTGAPSQQQGGELEWPDDDDQQRPQLLSERRIDDRSTYSIRKKTDTVRRAELLAAAKVEDMMNELQGVDPEDCEI